MIGSALAYPFCTCISRRNHCTYISLHAVHLISYVVPFQFTYTVQNHLFGNNHLNLKLHLTGILDHIISPRERQYVCLVDVENPALMLPINKSVTKLVNLTDKSCKDLLIYKDCRDGRSPDVRMMKREKVLSGNYLFVVQFLQVRN